MASIEECTQELIRAIHESREYQEYQNLREVTSGDEELHARLNEFRKRVYEVQTSGGTLDNYSDQEQLGTYATEFRKNELVDEYLKAELHVCRMIQKTMFLLAEAIDLDLDDVVS